tara:strand:- start:23801 stop:24787 length:987 start_codon:yes stop_codon:yes gene_type:complete
MKNKPLSNNNRIGLGCMGMSEFYGENNDEHSLSILRQAYDLGYRHFDTADMYGKGHNERLLGRFVEQLGSKRNELCIATKVGIKRDVDGPGSMAIDSSPEYILKACDESLARLGVEQIDLYYLHRRQKDVPIEETMGAMQQLIDAGKIASVGLSEVSTETLLAANKVVPISAIQSEYSLWSRDVEQGMLPLCDELDINFVAYSPIGRGFLSGNLSQEQVQDASDLRGKLPRFQPEAFAKNAALLNVLEGVAQEHDASSAQVALAWLLSRSDKLHIIPGARKLPHLTDNYNSAKLSLTDAQISSLSEVFVKANIEGERYPEPLMHTTNA